MFKIGIAHSLTAQLDIFWPAVTASGSSPLRKSVPPTIWKSGLARLVNERHVQHRDRPFPLTLAQLARLLGPDNAIAPYNLGE